MKTVKKIGNLLEIDGKLYEVENMKGKKDSEDIIFKQIKDKQKYLNILDELSKKLSPKLNSREVIRNALGELNTDEVRKLHASIINKKKIRVRQRHGCFEMCVGNSVIPIR